MIDHNVALTNALFKKAMIAIRDLRKVLKKMNEADMRYMKQLIAEGKIHEVLILLERRLEAIRDNRHYDRFKNDHNLK